MKIQFIWPNFDCPLGLSIGVAQLSGALKQAGHDTRIIHVCEWLEYGFDVDRQSLWLDLEILFRTIPAVLKRDGAY